METSSLVAREELFEMQLADIQARLPSQGSVTDDKKHLIAEIQEIQQSASSRRQQLYKIFSDAIASLK